MSHDSLYNGFFFIFLMHISIIFYFYDTFFIVNLHLEFWTNFKGISIFLIRRIVPFLYFSIDIQIGLQLHSVGSCLSIFYDPPWFVLYPVLPTRLFPPTPINIINFNRPSWCLIIWPWLIPRLLNKFFSTFLLYLALLLCLLFSRFSLFLTFFCSSTFRTPLINFVQPRSRFTLIFSINTTKLFRDLLSLL